MKFKFSLCRQAFYKAGFIAKSLCVVVCAAMVVSCGANRGGEPPVSSSAADMVTISTAPVVVPEVALSAQGEESPLPEGFVYVTQVFPDILLEMRYYSSYNFVGERIDGYEAPVAIMTQQAADALQSVAQALWQSGYILKIFDAYRPVSAVEHFTRWAEEGGDEMKEYFYPDIQRSQLFAQGYLATRSGHSRGSTVDLTIVDMHTGRELDMGTGFDYFCPQSHHGSSLVTADQTANREILRSAMVAGGFTPYTNEWWHYTLAQEPFPDTYFDFPVQ